MLLQRVLLLYTVVQLSQTKSSNSARVRRFLTGRLVHRCCAFGVQDWFLGLVTHIDLELLDQIVELLDLFSHLLAVQPTTDYVQAQVGVLVYYLDDPAGCDVEQSGLLVAHAYLPELLAFT